MPRFLTQRRLLALLAALTLVTSLLPAGCSHTLTHRPRWIIQWPLAPFTHLLNNLSTALRGRAGSPGLGEATELEQRYVEALALIRRHEAEKRILQEQIAHLTRIQQAGQMARIKQLMPASVTGWTTDGKADSAVVINRGQRQGVRAGMAVAAEGFYLVGRVTDDVGPVAATVRLIHAPGTLLNVRLARPTVTQPRLDTFCQLQLADDRRSFFAVIDADSPVAVGDLAHLDDDFWPSVSRGLIVGRVAEIRQHPDDPTLRRRIVVEPIPPLRALSRVIVIVPTEEELR